MAKGEKYTIEEVVERLKITSRTLHYYEEIGLIAPVCRTEGGHRLYDEQVIKRTEHILRLKHHLGSSLQEIREILEAETALEKLKESYHKETSDEAKARIVEKSIELLQNQVQRIDEKMEKLDVLKENFVERLERAKRIQRDTFQVKES